MTTPLSRLAAWLDEQEKLTDNIPLAARHGVYSANGPAPEKDPHAEWKRIVYPEETEAIAALCISHPRLVRIARAMLKVVDMCACQEDGELNDTINAELGSGETTE